MVPRSLLSKKKTRKRSIFHLLAILTAGVFVIEFAIMSLLCHTGFVECMSLGYSLFDSVILVVLLFPILYVSVYYPLKREISARERTERILRESEAKYRTLVDTSPDCIKLFDLDGKLLFLSPGGLQEHGLKSIEEAKKWDFMGSIIEEDREKFKAAFLGALEGKISTQEIRHTAEGANREVCLVTIAPVKSENGEVISVFGVSRDISDIKTLERTKNSLTQMIVHDLNNPLFTLSGYLELIRTDTEAKLSPSQLECIRKSNDVIGEIAGMTANLLDVGKMEENKLSLKYGTVDLNGFLRSMFDAMSTLAGQNGNKIVLDLSEPIPAISADESIIKRVISNVAGNAVKFSPPGADIEIKTAYDEKSGEATVSIRDHGPGIPKAYREKIFEKFVQLHMNKDLKNRMGKGLGLTFCKMAVEAHGGRIRVEGEVGKGSTFIVALPVKRT
jgi:PAS domain S-box-containing protein